MAQSVKPLLSLRRTCRWDTQKPRECQALLLGLWCFWEARANRKDWALACPWREYGDPRPPLLLCFLAIRRWLSLCPLLLPCHIISSRNYSDGANWAWVEMIPRQSSPLWTDCLGKSNNENLANAMNHSEGSSFPWPQSGKKLEMELGDVPDCFLASRRYPEYVPMENYTTKIFIKWFCSLPRSWLENILYYLKVSIYKYWGQGLVRWNPPHTHTHRARRPEFSPWDQHGRRRKATPTSCSEFCACTHKLTHARKINKM